MEDGLVHASEEGTPQGSILSPLLSNIYLNYVLDLWFSWRVSRQSRGEAYYFRFADDFLKSFQISVETYERTVQLSGFVGSEKAVDKAGEIARRVKGITSLKNDLIVK